MKLGPEHFVEASGAELGGGVGRVAGKSLVVGDAAVGPHVVGLLRPIIVVPPALLDDAALLRAALLHEVAHVRRRDAIGRFIQVAATSMMWWFPLVRVVNRRLDLAREAACDAWALAGDVVALPRAPSRAEPTDLLHDLKSPLMTILANAEHLDDLSDGVPALVEALAHVPLAPEQRRLLTAILDDLYPISEELTTATRRLAQLVEQLHDDRDAAPPRRRAGSK